MVPPILNNKSYREESIFSAENLLREARRQKTLAAHPVPQVCFLDPDGDILDSLLAQKKAVLDLSWPCYHTKLYAFEDEGIRYGIIGRVVGASFAVLVAEELFASGCEFLISMTSSGQILPTREPPYFILIEKALRDEGTSYHYLPPAEFSHLNTFLLELLNGVFTGEAVPVERGSTWTTDAPFRETASAIAAHREEKIMAVEMEAAALYAFAEAKDKKVICLAHVTNQMAQTHGDFEKGIDNGSRDALRVITLIARTLLAEEKQ